MPTTVFLANTGSRQAEARFDEACDLLRENFVSLDETEAYDDVNLLQAAVRGLPEDPQTTVILGGGDGTLSCAAPIVAERGFTLGVMPLGTGNQFARDLQVDASLQLAAATIALGQVCPVDLGFLNDRPFLNVATFGLTTQIAGALKFKKQLGKLAYIPALFETLQDLKPFKAVITTDSYIQDEEAILFVVCNGRSHGGPFLPSPDATLTDGYLHGYLVEPAALWELIKLGTFALTGDHIDFEKVHYVQAKEFRFETDPLIPATIDGETETHQNIVFRSAPAALKVLVPETFEIPKDRRLPAQNLVS